MNKILKLLGLKYRNGNNFRFNWGEFDWHPKRLGLSFRYCNFGCCESKNLLVIEPLFFSLYIHLSEEYDRPWDDNGFSYGFYIYDWMTLNYGWGKDGKYWDFPYRMFKWFKTEIYDVDGNLKFIENEGDRNWNERYEIQNQIKVEYPYQYVLKNGEVQERTAKVHVSKMYWKRKWFPFLIKMKHCIDIDFNNEVGEQTGSWKGGCIGCSYEIKDGETPEQCLRRMEKERKF